MKKIILSLVCVLCALQGFAQFQGTKADYDKIKASFPKLTLNTYIPTLKSLDNPVLGDDIVKLMNMPAKRPASAQDAKHEYRAIGYFDYDENFATFFYLSLIPAQPDYSPMASIHFQIIDKKALKTAVHMSLGNILSHDMATAVKNTNRKRVWSYSKEGEIYFKIEDMNFANEEVADKTTLVRFDQSASKLLVVE
jgi:hypothetical protein